jgi:hypothetical protein
MYRISKLELDAIAYRVRLAKNSLRGEYPAAAVDHWLDEILEWCQDVFDDGPCRQEYNAINEPIDRP